MTTATTTAGTMKTGRPSAPMPNSVRLFHSTDLVLPCHGRREMFFNPRYFGRARRLCAGCPFLGRCGYNAVATGATHGVWGGMVLPGQFPARLAPIYARLVEQFEQRRVAEVGDVPVAPLTYVKGRANSQQNSTAA